MRYYQISFRHETRLVVETSDDVLMDLTSVSGHVRTLLDLLRAASISGKDIDLIARDLIDRGACTKYSLQQIEETSATGAHGPYLLPPIWPEEVWAAGVTYQDSMKERQVESETPDVYAKVYKDQRPEIFLKSTPKRTVGSFMNVGIRSDSEWNVPEPELTFILYDSKIVGFTIGNDMSSRTIEGANPLYLPQAKLYDKSCAIGPCFVPASEVKAPQHLRVDMAIHRDRTQVFSGTTSTANMKRTCYELSDWVQRHNPVPDGTAVMTGTGIIPPPEFSLKEGDVVTVEVEAIGRLVNTVVCV